jgi:hypothetical protein
VAESIRSARLSFSSFPAVFCDESVVGPAGEGEVVEIQQGGQPVGGLAQFLGFESRGDARQIRLGEGTGLVVDMAGQIGEELADDAHMLGADVVARLPGRGVGQRGSRGSPLMVVRGPRSSASSRRRRASSLEIRNRVHSTSTQDLPPRSIGLAWQVS